MTPAMTDVDGLKERLRAKVVVGQKVSDKGADGLITRRRNPDGPEALAYIAALEGKLERARESLKAVSDDLHAELMARYGDDHAHYPSIRRKFEADMEVVTEARTTLASIEDKEDE